MCTRCEELEEQVRELHRVLQGPPEDFKLGLSFGMTYREAQIFALLKKHGLRSREQILYACWSPFGSYAVREELEAPDKIVDVYIHKVRRKLLKSGAPYAIQTNWGSGWTLVALA